MQNPLAPGYRTLLSLHSEMRFEFPFNLIGKLIMAFLLGQLWSDTNPGTLIGADPVEEE